MMNENSHKWDASDETIRHKDALFAHDIDWNEAKKQVNAVFEFWGNEHAEADTTVRGTLRRARSIWEKKFPEWSGDVALKDPEAFMNDFYNDQGDMEFSPNRIIILLSDANYAVRKRGKHTVHPMIFTMVRSMLPECLRFAVADYYEHKDNERAILMRDTVELCSTLDLDQTLAVLKPITKKGAKEWISTALFHVLSTSSDSLQNLRTNHAKHYANSLKEYSTDRICKMPRDDALLVTQDRYDQIPQLERDDWIDHSLMNAFDRRVPHERGAEAGILGIMDFLQQTGYVSSNTCTHIQGFCRDDLQERILHCKGEDQKLAAFAKEFCTFPSCRTYLAECIKPVETSLEEWIDFNCLHPSISESEWFEWATREIRFQQKATRTPCTQYLSTLNHREIENVTKDACQDSAWKRYKSGDDRVRKAVAKNPLSCALLGDKLRLNDLLEACPAPYETQSDLEIQTRDAVIIQQLERDQYESPASFPQSILKSCATILERQQSKDSIAWVPENLWKEIYFLLRNRNNPSLFGEDKESSIAELVSFARKQDEKHFIRCLKLLSGEEVLQVLEAMSMNDWHLVETKGIRSDLIAVLYKATDEAMQKDIPDALVQNATDASRTTLWESMRSAVVEGEKRRDKTTAEAENAITNPADHAGVWNVLSPGLAKSMVAGGTVPLYQRVDEGRGMLYAFTSALKTETNSRALSRFWPFHKLSSLVVKHRKELAKICGQIGISLAALFMVAAGIFQGFSALVHWGSSRKSAKPEKVVAQKKETTADDRSPPALSRPTPNYLSDAGNIAPQAPDTDEDVEGDAPPPPMMHLSKPLHGDQRYLIRAFAGGENLYTYKQSNLKEVHPNLARYFGNLVNRERLRTVNLPQSEKRSITLSIPKIGRSNNIPMSLGSCYDSEHTDWTHDHQDSLYLSDYNRIFLSPNSLNIGTDDSLPFAAKAAMNVGYTFDLPNQRPQPDTSALPEQLQEDMGEELADSWKPKLSPEVLKTLAPELWDAVEAARNLPAYTAATYLEHVVSEFINYIPVPEYETELGTDYEPDGSGRHEYIEMILNLKDGECGQAGRLLQELLAHVGIPSVSIDCYRADTQDIDMSVGHVALAVPMLSTDGEMYIEIFDGTPVGEESDQSTEPGNNTPTPDQVAEHDSTPEESIPSHIGQSNENMGSPNSTSASIPLDSFAEIDLSYYGKEARTAALLLLLGLGGGAGFVLLNRLKTHRNGQQSTQGELEVEEDTQETESDADDKINEEHEDDGDEEVHREESHVSDELEPETKGEDSTSASNEKVDDTLNTATIDEDTILLPIVGDAPRMSQKQYVAWREALRDAWTCASELFIASRCPALPLDIPQREFAQAMQSEDTAHVAHELQEASLTMAHALHELVPHAATFMHKLAPNLDSATLFQLSQIMALWMYDLQNNPDALDQWHITMGDIEPDPLQSQLYQLLLQHILTEDRYADTLSQGNIYETTLNEVDVERVSQAQRLRLSNYQIPALLELLQIDMPLRYSS